MLELDDCVKGVRYEKVGKDKEKGVRQEANLAWLIPTVWWSISLAHYQSLHVPASRAVRLSIVIGLGPSNGQFVFEQAMRLL